MSAAAQPDRLDLEHTVAQYAIGELLSQQPLAARGHNQSYLLQIRYGGRETDFILTFAEPHALPTSSYVALLDRCAEAGLPVADLVRTEKNLPYATSDGVPAFLAKRLTGRTVHNPTLQQLQAVGRFTARLHCAAAAIEYLMPDFPKTISWLRNQGARLHGHVAYGCADLIDESTQRVSSLLRRADVAELPTGVIHSGLRRDSILFNERGLTGALNLDQAAQGTLLYDLAVAANDWCSDSGGVLDPERMLALLKGYQSIRPLTKQELWFLPGFALYAALTAWLSRLCAEADGVYSSTEPPRFCSPNELQLVVQQQLAHAFYLDERLLH